MESLGQEVGSWTVTVFSARCSLDEHCVSPHQRKRNRTDMSEDMPFVLSLFFYPLAYVDFQDMLGRPAFKMANPLALLCKMTVGQIQP